MGAEVIRFSIHAFIQYRWAIDKAVNLRYYILWLQPLLLQIVQQQSGHAAVATCLRNAFFFSVISMRQGSQP
jgi:hypothetical protein